MRGRSMVGTVLKRRIELCTAVGVAVALLASTPTAARADVATAQIDAATDSIASEIAGTPEDAGPDAESVDPVAVPDVAVSNAETATAAKDSVEPVEATLEQITVGGDPGEGVVTSLDAVDAADIVASTYGRKAMNAVFTGDLASGRELSASLSQRASDGDQLVVQQVSAADLGIDGAAFGLRINQSDPSADAEWVRVNVDLSGVRYTNGGDFGGRLQFALFPECVLDQPDNPACATGMPLDSVNVDGDSLTGLVPADSSAGINLRGAFGNAKRGAGGVRSGDLVAPLTALLGMDAASAGQGTIIAAVAGVAGPGGTFAKTDLAPTGQWGVSQQAGAFTYDLPFDAPATEGGPTPDLTLHYNSQIIDGHTPASNGQGSWIADGWDLQSNYIERVYSSCTDLGVTTHGNDLCWSKAFDPATYKVNGAAVTVADFDAYDTASYVLSLNGASYQLFPLGKGRYTTSPDSGLVIERQARGAGTNGDDNGEYFRVWTPDGSVYYFGFGSNGAASTGSVATVQEWGVNAGDPQCIGACRQGYRWMLDQQFDALGSGMVTSYTSETNAYAQSGTSTVASYTSAIYPAAIEYGGRQGGTVANPTVTGTTAKVSFVLTPRCVENTMLDVMGKPLTNGAIPCSVTPATSAASFPDVPRDLICTSGCNVTTQRTPAFFRQQRLARIDTFVRSEEATAAWAPVASHALYSTYPLPAGADGRTLWLDGAYSKYFGDSPAATDDRTTYAATFDGALMANRVDWTTSAGKLEKRRVTRVRTDFGGEINVKYARSYVAGSTGGPCATTGRSTPTPADGASATWYRDNTWECYRAKTPTGAYGVYHRYLVSSIDLVDPVAQQPTQTYTYTYGFQGASHALWTYEDSVFKTRDVNNIDAQDFGSFIGYPKVTVSTGSGEAKSSTVTYFFQGRQGTWNGVELASAMLDLPDGYTDPVDLPALAGSPALVRKLDSANRVVSESLTAYSVVTRADGKYNHDATIAQAISVKNTATDYSTGVAKSLTGKQEFTYDPTRPWLVLTQTSTPDISQPASNVTRTSTEYTVGDTASYPNAVWTPTGPAPFFELPTHATTEVQDGAAWITTSEWKGDYREPGDVVRGLVVKESTRATADAGPKPWLESTATYDDRGRILTAKGPFETQQNSQVSWAYEPSVGTVPVRHVTVTNQMGWTNEQWVSSAFGQVIKTKDANGDYSHFRYDAAGMLEAAWAPRENALEGDGDLSDLPSASTVPTVSYAYDIYAGPLQVRTKPVVVLSAQLAAMNGTTPVSSAQTSTVRRSYEFYDGFGRVVETHVPALDAGGGRLITKTSYDGVGRAVRQSEPYLDSSKPAQAASGLSNAPWTSIPRYSESVYDSLGRALTSTLHYQTGAGQNATQLLSTSSYGLMATTNTSSATGATSTTTVDALGRTTELRQTPATGSPQAAAGAEVVTAYSYVQTADGSTVTVTDDASNATVFHSDLAGRRVQMVDPNAGTSNYTYTAGGKVESIVSPAGTIEFVYDALGRMTSRKANGTEVARWVYDPAGHRGAVASETAVNVVDGTALSVIKTYAYNALHQLQSTTVQLPESALLGDLSGDSYQTTAGYDAVGQQVTQTMSAFEGLPEQAVTSGLDRLGRARSLTVTGDGSTKTLVTGAAFDSLGRLKSRSYGDDLVKSLGYDAKWGSVSNVTTATNGGGVTVQNDSYAFDDAGRVTAIADTAGAATVTHQFRHDGFNRLGGSWATTGAGTADQVAPQPSVGVSSDLTYSTGYAYSDTGKINQVIDQWAGTVTDYTYLEPKTSVDDVSSDAAVTSVQTRPNGAQALATDGFDGAGYSSGAGWAGPWVETGDGAVSDATSGNIVLTGGALELTGVVSGQAPVVSRQLAAAGALTADVDVDLARGAQALEVGDVVSVRVIADGDAQRTVTQTVTGDTLTGTPGTVSVDATTLLPATSLTVELTVVSGVVDTDGDGAEVVRVDAVNVGINTPDAADTFTYDKAGRMVSRTVDGETTTLSWDVLSNLVGTSGRGGTRWYVYDASGQRVAQVREPGVDLSGPTPGTATVYVGATEASDTDTGTPGVGVSATRFYAVGGATVATLNVAGGVSQWSLMLGDSQGSAQVMVDLVVSGAAASGFAPITSATAGVTRTAYMPYGSGRGTGELSIDRGWLGQVEDDDTGLVYLNARYYDPVLGRFLSPDPLMNPGDPRTLDPYRYADNNPVVFTDASGLAPGFCTSIGPRDYQYCQTIGQMASPDDQFKAGYVDGSTDRLYAMGYGLTPEGLKATASSFQQEREQYGFWTAAAHTGSGAIAVDDMADMAGCASGPIMCNPYDFGHSGGGLGTSTTVFAAMATASVFAPEAGYGASAVKPPAGQAVKNWAAGIRTNNPSSRTVVIGREMDLWVKPQAQVLGAGTYKGTPQLIHKLAGKVSTKFQMGVDMAFNKAWINAQMRAGKTIRDVGQRPGVQLRPSDFYVMERDATRHYRNLVR